MAANLIVERFVRVPAGDGGKLLRHLESRRKRFAAALPEKHYRALATDLHQESA